MKRLLPLALALALTPGMANPWIAGWIATRGWVGAGGSLRVDYGARVQWDGAGWFLAGDLPNATVLAGVWGRVGTPETPLRLYLGAGYALESGTPLGELSVRTPSGLFAAVSWTEGSPGARLGFAVGIPPPSLH